ncbi:MAG: hypothetical protein C1943_18450 [Halochromatium sp.]|nr:hypothetical protein [Halochromatium sp.]
MRDGSTMKLKDLCDFVADQVDPSDRGEDVYVGLEHVTSGRFERIGAGRAEDVRSSKYLFKPNDVLYGKLRPYLDKAVLAPDTGICTTELLVLRPRSDVDPRFLVGLVHSPSFVEHAVAGTTGVQHPRTSWHHISEYELPDFDPEEQSDIADLLWEIHDAITANETLIETGLEAKRAAMRTLFTRGLRGEAQKDSEIGLVPESWVPTIVAKIGTVKGGKRMPKGISLVQEDTGRPYIRVTDFKDHRVRDEGILFVPRGYEEVIRRYRISARDVYISIAGTIGLVGQVPQHLDDANLTENAAKIVFERDDLVPRYVMYALAGQTCQEQIERATAKNAQPKLALTRIEQILVPLPQAFDEQSEIVAILDAIDRKIDLHRRKRAVLDDLFKALLHKLMTGEIRVADLDLSALAPNPSAELAA